MSIWRYPAVELTCCLDSIATMMFITSMEIPVLITALVAITENLGGFGDASWVVSSYLLGYVGMLYRVQFLTSVITYTSP